MSTETLKNQVCEIIEDVLKEDISTCHVCQNQKKVRQLNINVFGPEGIKVCEDCELKIIEFVFQLSVPKKHTEDNNHNLQ